MDALNVEELIEKPVRQDLLETDDQMDALDADELATLELDDDLPSELNDPMDQKEIERQVKQNQVQLALQILDTELISAESMEIQKANEQENEITWLTKQLRQLEADIEEYRRWITSDRIPHFDFEELENMKKDYQNRLQKELDKSVITLQGTQEDKKEQEQPL